MADSRASTRFAIRSRTHLCAPGKADPSRHKAALLCRFLLLDPPHYLRPYPLPLLPDVVSFSFFINTAEDFVRISIAFQEIAHDSPDITTRGTAPDRGLIKEVS